MPLFEKVRIEVYLPDVPDKPVYEGLLSRFNEELTLGFGGCTVIRGVQGSFRSQTGIIIPDRVNLLYTDLPYPLHQNFEMMSRYTAALRLAAFEALEEEVVLVVAYPVFWSA